MPSKMKKATFIHTEASIKMKLDLGGVINAISLNAMLMLKPKQKKIS
jgi:hypothetical protein